MVLRSGRSYARNYSAFTLVEIMTVVVIIGILASIAMANFINSQNKAKNASVIDNMHTAQLCAETYATDNSGVYPALASDMYPYYPNGGNNVGGTPGKLPQNPYTGLRDEPLYKESIADSATIVATRSAAAAASPGTAGQVGYNQCDKGGTSYCVSGTDGKNMRIVTSNGKTLVLSNQ